MSETVSEYDERPISRGKFDRPSGDDFRHHSQGVFGRPEAGGEQTPKPKPEPAANGGLSQEAANLILATAARADAAEEHLAEITDNTADDLFRTASEALAMGQPVDGASVASALLQAGGGLDEYGLDWRTSEFVEEWGAHDPQAAQGWADRMLQAQHAILADAERAEAERAWATEQHARSEALSRWIDRRNLRDSPELDTVVAMLDMGLQETARTDPDAASSSRLEQTLDAVYANVQHHNKAAHSEVGRHEFKSGFQREMALSGKLGADVREAQIAAERAARLALREPTLQDVVDTAAARRPATADEKAAAVAAFKAELKETARNKFSEGNREGAARAERAAFEEKMEKAWARGRR